MTKESAKEYIPLIQAWADGKQLQIFKGGVWRDFAPCSRPSWKHPVNLYRIKPEVSKTELKPARPEFLEWCKFRRAQIRSNIRGLEHLTNEHRALVSLNDVLIKNLESAIKDEVELGFKTE